jgi:hypothetical protein
MKRVFIGAFFAAALVAVSLGAGSALAQSSQAAWRFANLVSLPAASASSSGAATNDTGWVSILTTHIKTPNGKELAMGVSLQCGLVTDTTVRSKNGDLDSSSARGRIRVRVKITQPDGTVVYGQPNNGADLATDISFDNSGDGLTYCDRYQKLEAKFSGLNCTADADTGDVTCADPEELRLLLSTLEATHFNFIHANAMPGIQTVEVQARAQAGIALGGTKLGAAGAEAFAGAGALSVQTIRLVKDADGTTDLSNLN